ncbi:MAG: hypothetical protein ACTS6J_04005 [Burkholderiales bacterium]
MIYEQGQRSIDGRPDPENCAEGTPNLPRRKALHRRVNAHGFCGGTVSVELQSEKMPDEAQIVLVTIPAVVAFAANQSTHENRSADSLQHAFAYRALRYATVFNGRRLRSHLVPYNPFSSCNHLALPNPFNYSMS